MTNNSIHLSPKHGVNPSLMVCPICGKDTGVALLGRLKMNPKTKEVDPEAPRIIAADPCNDCSKALAAGAVMLIEVRDGESGDSPYRTGYIAGIKKDAAAHLFENVDIEKQRIFFIEETIMKKIMGPLYKQEVNNV